MPVTRAGKNLADIWRVAYSATGLCLVYSPLSFSIFKTPPTTARVLPIEFYQKYIRKRQQYCITYYYSGVGKEHPFIAAFAEKLASRGFRGIHFDFPYMIRAWEIGKRRLPDKQAVLIKVWQNMTEWFDAEKLIIGEKSLGSRIASFVTDMAQVKGLVCLGYPFHAPGKLEKPRTEHLLTLATPTLIC